MEIVSQVAGAGSLDSEMNLITIRFIPTALENIVRWYNDSNVRRSDGAVVTLQLERRGDDYVLTTLLNWDR